MYNLYRFYRNRFYIVRAGVRMCAAFRTTTDERKAARTVFKKQNIA